MRSAFLLVAVGMMVAVAAAGMAMAQELKPVHYSPTKRVTLGSASSLDLQRSYTVQQPVIIVAAMDPAHALKVGDQEIVQFGQIMPLGWSYQTEWVTFRFRSYLANLFMSDPPGSTSGGMLLCPDVQFGIRPAPAFPVYFRLVGEFNYRVDVLNDEDDLNADYPAAYAIGTAELVADVWPRYIRGFPYVEAAAGARGVAVWSRQKEDGESGDVEFDEGALLFGGRLTIAIPFLMSNEDAGTWDSSRRAIFLGAGYYGNGDGDRDIQWTLDVRAMWH